MSRPTWIFGYGSLVWRPAFAFEQRRPGFVRGWVRRFWQSSVDHRGVPEAPGRVVTLVPQPGAECFGVAYQVAASAVETVLAGLDHREQGGYTRHEIDVHTADGVIEAAVMYVAGPTNPCYAGERPLSEIAEQVRRSHGPSGSNLEYVVRLADALAEHGAVDEHVFALASLLRESR